MIGSRKVLVVEDNLTTSKTLKLFLSKEGYEVQCALDGNQAIQLFQVHDFDLIMLDLMLPDVDGLTICQMIREKSEVPIIILTAKTTEDEIVEGLEKGADDYVCKPFGSKELLARVRRCLKTRRQDSNSATTFLQVGEIELQLDKRLACVGGQEVKLTKSEFELLRVLMQNPGRVFTRDQLIDHALGSDFDGFDRTIDTHIWSLRKKIGEPRGNPKYILSEMGVGYRMSEQHA